MDILSEGQKIALIFPKDSSFVEMTCVIDKVSDDRLYLQLPQYFMRYVEYLHEGAEITAKVFSKLGTIDFNTIVINSPLDEEEFTIELDYNSVKLTPGEDMPVINAIEKLEVIKDKEHFNLKTYEISTEYMKFYSDRKFEVGDILECTITFPKDYGTIMFRASVSEVDPIYDNEFTAVYITMTESARQALLYYMYVYSTDSEQDEI